MLLRFVWAVVALVALGQAGCFCWHHHGFRHCCYPLEAAPPAGPAR